MADVPPDRTTRLRYVNGAPHLALPAGRRYRIEVRADRRHRFRVVATIQAPAEADFLYPIGASATDDVRAVRLEAA